MSHERFESVGQIEFCTGSVVRLSPNTQLRAAS